MKEMETCEYPNDTDDDSSISIDDAAKTDNDNDMIDEREEASIEVNKEKGLHNDEEDKSQNNNEENKNVPMTNDCEKMLLLMMMIINMMR